MPEWIHQRAEHLLAKNPSMPKSEAFAIATQQAHSVGKSPKGYGTEAGREEAKEKYDTPKDDKKTANPGELSSPKMAGVLNDWHDLLHGGRADGLKPSYFPAGMLHRGASHEKEHTNNPHIAKEIAMDHLVEDPYYYEKLEKIEKESAALFAMADEFKKIAFQTSMYSGPLSYGPFPMASSQPGYRHPQMAYTPAPKTAEVKEAVGITGGNTTGPGRLASSQSVGHKQGAGMGPGIATLAPRPTGKFSGMTLPGAKRGGAF